MRIVALVAALFAAACLGNSAAGPDRPIPTSPIPFAELDAAGAMTIATGGTQIVTIADPLAIGLSGEATTSYEVVPFGGLWPDAQQGTYTVRALAAGSGAFSIATAKGVAAGAVASADVDRVVVLPAAYELDGHSAFAIDVDRPAIEAALFDADDNRLVDGSLVIAGSAASPVAPVAWDTATLPATVGSYAITVTADSAPTLATTLAVAASYDSVVQTTDDLGRTCYHAYAGAVEVATAMTALVAPDPTATNCELLQ
jgi:hypothetical protein